MIAGVCVYGTCAQGWLRSAFVAELDQGYVWRLPGIRYQGLGVDKSDAFLLHPHHMSVRVTHSEGAIPRHYCSIATQLLQLGCLVSLSPAHSTLSGQTIKRSPPR